MSPVVSRFAPLDPMTRVASRLLAFASLLVASALTSPIAVALAQDPLATLDDDDVPAERRAELARVLAHARTYLAESAGDPARLELADRACVNAARLDGRSSEVEIVWARVTIARGEVAGAIRHAERAATLAPQSFDAQLLHASLLLDIRDARRAKIAYERALALRATSYEARLGLALSLRLTKGFFIMTFQCHGVACMRDRGAGRKTMGQVARRRLNNHD